jgi:serine/threonine-protein kinase
MDSAGKTQPLIPTPAHYMDWSLSPDGRRLAIETLEAGTSLSVYDIDRAALMRLTFSGRANHSPVWAPDGKHIVYVSQMEEGGEVIMWIRADGAGEPRRLRQSTNAMGPRSFSPDGRHLAFAEFSAETNSDIWTLPIDSSDADHPKAGKPEVFLQTPFNEMFPVISPDGRWMAYVSNESGTTEVYVRPFAGGSPASGGKWQISIGAGMCPVWSRAARQLFYVAYDINRETSRVIVTDYTVEGESFHVGRQHAWVDKEFRLTVGQRFALAPDGKRIVWLQPQELADEPKGNLHLTLLVNWFDEVRRRMTPVAK